MRTTLSSELPHTTKHKLGREFLDPFFGALGWDIANEAGVSDAYKDVIHDPGRLVG